MVNSGVGSPQPIGGKVDRTHVTIGDKDAADADARMLAAYLATH